MLKRLLFCAGLILVLSTSAEASILNFYLWGPGAASSSFFATMPSDFTPVDIAADGSSFAVDDVTYIRGGFFPCPCTGRLTFYTPKHHGGVEISGGGTTPAHYETAQLFSGPITHPVIDLGTYDGVFIAPDNFYSGGPATIVITETPDPAVPEPATGAMLLAGALLLFASRRKLNRARISDNVQSGLSIA
ncbi:hypothetical protein FHS83_002729 [Rhizomicrobium palustre]|uniref:Ice-binding protein C-terminal domain-containing protein n=1 Tax=Rhizomicrobium palustre TaxID=189966 RepID=A0A846N279_9PROT|nr:PEP-CTERM sorting domain-containing protein [Rhizomicrobium palustre]NIK89411.1 hypothetical protein [Rhizomicrobium palustre]